MAHVLDTYADETTADQMSRIVFRVLIKAKQKVQTPEIQLNKITNWSYCFLQEVCILIETID